MTRAEIDWFYPTVHVKNQVLRNLFTEGLFQTLSHRISCCIHIVKTPCSQLPSRSGIFCLLVEVVYLPSNLKFEYPIINLAFLGIIIKAKIIRKFLLAQFWMILFPNKWCKIFFVSCPRHCNQGLILIHCILFSNLKQKTTNFYLWVPCILRHPVYTHIYLIYAYI